MYKNKNGRYMVRETGAKRDVSKCLGKLEFDRSEDSGTWNVVRRYEGRFSAKEAIGEIIKVHMGGRINV